MSGMLYAIGAGPGDPELITAKGLRLLREAALVFLPATRPGHSYAGSIIAGHLDRTRQEVVELVCPPFRDRSAIEGRWEELAGVVADHLAPGRTGAFVCEGDPSLYSTFLHLRRGLERNHPNVGITVIPGVTSVSASAALAGLPLAAWDERLLIAPALYGSGALTTMFGAAETVALLKPGRQLPALLDAAQSSTPPLRAALVRRAGRTEEQVLHDAAAMRALDGDYFTTLLLRRSIP